MAKCVYNRNAKDQVKNTKYKVNLYAFVGYVAKRGEKRKREKENKKRRRLSKA